MIDHNSSLENSYLRGREEGREEGIALGEAKGREEGITVGEARGREEGRINALAPAVENLRRAGLDDDTIADSLQLTPAEREALLTAR